MGILVNGKPIDYSGLPAHMREGFRLYFEHGVLPGSFGTAVLENDLMGALGKADEININRLKDYGMFLYNCVPSGSYGSRALVQAWVEARQQEEANYD